jgi:defect-in-organelle-trafficking protein DotD
MLKLIYLSFLSLMLGLTGCSVLQKQCDFDEQKIICKESCNPEPPLPACSNADIQNDLVLTANSIERSLNVLASAQEAESPPVINIACLITPEGGMGGKIDIDWTGPVEPLIEKIAKMTEYRVKILGNEPAIPIIITITAKDTMIAEVLQNASFQSGKRAHILVFPENHVIEVRYLPA